MDSIYCRNSNTMNVVRDITGRQRNRLYLYESYMNILNEGLEPPTGWRYVFKQGIA